MIENIIDYIDSLFETRDMPSYREETGLNLAPERPIQTLGYATNLTLETVEGAKAKGVDLLLTHHDAWDFIFGLKATCMEVLETAGIGHYFNHLPLDDCDFGTNGSLMDVLDLDMVDKTHQYDGYYCGRLAKTRQVISFKDFVSKLEDRLGEPVRAWNYGPDHVDCVGLVCGAGGLTTLMEESIKLGSDTYISGEHNLYAIQYAQFTKTNLIIGSHTFTELFGIEHLAKKVGQHFGLNVVQVQESHIEATDHRP